MKRNIVSFIPGAAYQLAKEGTPGPLAERALESATVVKRGRGHQAILVMTAAEANALADYFWSVAGVVGDMTAAERDGGNEHKAAQQAVLRIEASIRAHA